MLGMENSVIFSPTCKMKVHFTILIIILLIVTKNGATGQTTTTATTACTLNCKLTGQPQNVTCALDPESVEGPYYLPVHLLRSNIKEDRTGVPLKLHLTVVDSSKCEPVSDATVDIRHADAFGVYSGYGNSLNTTFLRGIQQTDKEGSVLFETVYPGDYDGRCIHIHVEIYIAGELKHTGQLYFQETLSETVRTQAEPYKSRKYNKRPVPITKDHVYTSTKGVETTFDPVQMQGDVKTGFTVAMFIGIDPTVSMKQRLHAPAG